MNNFDSHLGGMADIPQFFLWRLEWNASEGKYNKTPCAPDGSVYRIDASQPQNWMDYDAAQLALSALPRTDTTCYSLGWWMTPDSPYWFFDLDKCAGGDQWLPLALQFSEGFKGAMVEASSSNKGLHIIGMGAVPEHRNKPPRDIATPMLPMQLEFYTANRGICFGLTQQAIGCADARFEMAAFVERYFPKSAASDVAGDRRPEWRGPEDDDSLIERMLSARVSAAAAFGGKASLPQLWRGETPKDSEHDMALAQHLAWWTGGDAERMERLMRRSGMVRPKWDERRPGGTYLTYTISNAIDGCTSCYQQPLPRSDTNDEAGAVNHTTELSNAYRLQRAHGASMMAVAGIGWHVWGERGPWLQDDHAAHRLAFGLGKEIQDEADGLDNWVYQATLDGLGLDECKRRADVQKNRARWAKASESKAVIDHSLSLAERLMGVPAETLDASPHLIGCPSGVIDLTTCTMRDHRKEDRITKRIACDYDPAARAPVWERFVSEIMGSDAVLIDYLQTLVGYIMSGTRGEHLLPVFHGTGANGKSTFLNALQNLMGDYAGTAAPGLLISRNGSEHPTGLAALQGRRLVIVSETAEGGRLNEEQVKVLTGGDRITARRMRQDFYEFDPTHIIVLQTNHKPRVTGTDEGIWRRMKLIPFTVTIPPEQRDAKLPEKLAAESAGILAWAMDGWRKYQQFGFREPEAVRVATADYRSDSDHVGAFITDRCLVGPNYTVSASGLYMAYAVWCASNGEHPMTQRSLGLRLSERPGVDQSRTKQARMWRGLGIDAHAHLGQNGFPALPDLKR